MSRSCTHARLKRGLGDEAYCLDCFQTIDLEAPSQELLNPERRSVCMDCGTAIGPLAKRCRRCAAKSVGSLNLRKGTHRGTPPVILPPRAHVAVLPRVREREL